MAQEKSRDQEASTSALKRLTEEVHTNHDYKLQLYMCRDLHAGNHPVQK